MACCSTAVGSQPDSTTARDTEGKTIRCNKHVHYKTPFPSNCIKRCCRFCSCIGFCRVAGFMRSTPSIQRIGCTLHPHPSHFKQDSVFFFVHFIVVHSIQRVHRVVDHLIGHLILRINPLHSCHIRLLLLQVGYNLLHLLRLHRAINSIPRIETTCLLAALHFQRPE